MLQRRIINQSYTYTGGGVVSFVCTIQFVAPDGVTVLDEVTATSTRNILADGWKEEIAAEVAALADLHESTLFEILTRTQAEFPTAQTPEQVVAQMAAYVEGVCNGVGQ